MGSLNSGSRRLILLLVLAPIALFISAQWFFDFSRAESATIVFFAAIAVAFVQAARGKLPD
jgi:hypothetical protein